MTRRMTGHDTHTPYDTPLHYLIQMVEKEYAYCLFQDLSLGSSVRGPQVAAAPVQRSVQEGAPLPQPEDLIPEETGEAKVQHTLQH